jgi:hypothetical protein
MDLASFQKQVSIPFLCFVSRRKYKKANTNAAPARGTRTIGITHSLLFRPDIYEHDKMPSKCANNNAK